VPGALVPPLPVDHHRPGQHETRYPCLRHGGEQYGGPEVVVGDVLRRVGDPVAEPDPRGLVAHGVHTGQGTADGGRVPHVVGGVLPHVEHDRLVPALPEDGDHVGPDEPGTAGDQYAHTATLGPRPRRTTGPRPHVTTP
jgi:hypothetical protein